MLKAIKYRIYPTKAQKVLLDKHIGSARFNQVNSSCFDLIKQWKCVKCGANHDRDKNATLNIKNFALRNHVSGTDTKTHSELPTLVGVLTYEASSPLGKR